MKKNLFTNPAFLFALSMFCSCSDVQFEKPQPDWIKNETMIPKNLQGYYASGKDTLRITEKRIVDNKIKPEFDLNLLDSVILKIYSHTYFLNVYDEEKKNWEIIMGKEEKNYILLYTLSFRDSTVQKKLKEITTVKEIKDSSGGLTDCIINPTAEEFRKILEQNLFTLSSDTLKKVK